PLLLLLWCCIVFMTIATTPKTIKFFQCITDLHAMSLCEEYRVCIDLSLLSDTQDLSFIEDTQDLLLEDELFFSGSLNKKERNNNEIHNHTFI
ncbi:MAG: hypothetical protein IKX14_07010, partial [Neisseriaceae bacterium]|nr:hypothetical protein [Neisseriaceae bacterium]